MLVLVGTNPEPLCKYQRNKEMDLEQYIKRKENDLLCLALVLELPEVEEVVGAVEAAVAASQN